VAGMAPAAPSGQYDVTRLFSNAYQP